MIKSFETLARLLTPTKQEQQQKQQREGTASALHMLADVGTHPEAKTNAAQR